MEVVWRADVLESARAAASEKFCRAGLTLVASGEREGLDHEFVPCTCDRRSTRRDCELEDSCHARTSTGPLYGFAYQQEGEGTPVERVRVCGQTRGAHGRVPFERWEPAQERVQRAPAPRKLKGLPSMAARKVLEGPLPRPRGQSDEDYRVRVIAAAVLLGDFQDGAAGGSKFEIGAEHLDDVLRLVASDGHRLAVVETALPGGDASYSLTHDECEHARYTGELKLACTDVLHTPPWRLAAEAAEAQSLTVVVAVEELADALRSAFQPDNRHGQEQHVRLRWAEGQGVLRVSTKTEDGDEITVCVTASRASRDALWPEDAETTADQVDQGQSFQWRYLRDALQLVAWVGDLDGVPRARRLCAVRFSPPNWTGKTANKREGLAVIGNLPGGQVWGRMMVMPVREREDCR